MADQYKIFSQVKKDEPELNHIYYGENLMANFNSFSSNLKKDEILKHEELIPQSEAHLYYDNQSVRQVFKPVVNDGIYRHILAFYPFERMFMDTMYIRLHNSTLAFCNIIDLFSKFAFSKVFVIGSKSQAIKSSQSVGVFEDFLDEIKQYGYEKKDLGVLVCDAGSEFLGDFVRYLNDNEILYNYANAGDKKKTSPVERFNRTLRLYLEKYRVIYGKIDSKVLKVITKAYNNVKHAGLEFTPIEILTTKEDQSKTEEHFMGQEQLNHITGLTVGQSVRVLIDRGAFHKIKPLWSAEVYTIKKVLNDTNYELNEIKGFYHLDELQPINTDFLLNDKKVKIEKDEPEELPPSYEPLGDAPAIIKIKKEPEEFIPRTSGRTVVPNRKYL